MDEPIVYFGSAVKALGGGRVGGWLVEFSDPATQKGIPDLDREYFTCATDFDIEDGQKATVYYDHGLDPTLKTRKIGRGTMAMKDDGVWFEAQLALRDDYEKWIYKLAEMGKLGWSSGTAPHLVTRKKGVNDTMEILSWPLGNDASLTPMPASPTNRVSTLKSVAPTLKALIDEIEQDEIETKSISLEGLPALSQVVSPADLNKGMLDRSTSVESAVKEFLAHGEVIGDVLKAHAVRVEGRVKFRVDQKGHIPLINLEHIASMLQDLDAMSEGFAAIRSDLKRIQNAPAQLKSQILDEATRFERSKFLRVSPDADRPPENPTVLDEAAKFELWNFLRITGNTPKE